MRGVGGSDESEMSYVLCDGLMRIIYYFLDRVLCIGFMSLIMGGDDGAAEVILTCFMLSLVMPVYDLERSRFLMLCHNSSDAFFTE